MSMVALRFCLVLSLDSLTVREWLPVATGLSRKEREKKFSLPKAEIKALLSGLIGAIWSTCPPLALDHEMYWGLL